MNETIKMQLNSAIVLFPIHFCPAQIVDGTLLSHLQVGYGYVLH